MFKFPPLASLSSGSNLVKVKDQRSQKIQTLQDKFSAVTIVTSCGTFVVFSENYFRLSNKLLDSFIEDDLNLLHCRAWDHEVFVFIHRYIEMGIKVNLATVCSRLGITEFEAVMLLEKWGYDSNITL